MHNIFVGQKGQKLDEHSLCAVVCACGAAVDMRANLWL